MSSELTVEKLAKQVGGIPLDRLIKQLRLAGVMVNSGTDVITDQDRELLLTALKGEQSKAAETSPARKISLKRTSTSTLKVKSASGKNATVNVVSKKRRTYVKREEVEEPEVIEPEAPPAVESPVAKDDTKNTPDPAVEVKPTAEEKAKDSKSKKDTKPAKKVEEASTNASAPAKSDKKKESKERDRERENRSERSERDGKRKTKAQLLEEANGDERRRRFKPKSKYKKVEDNPHAFALPVEPQTYDVKIPETITVAELASAMSVKAASVIKVMMQMGAMATINQVIDQDTASLVVEEMGHNAIPIKDTSIEESVGIDYAFDPVTRPPIVTVMGHVDHGKTSLLDYIRSTKVTTEEAGGITQHIGAYQVDTPRGPVAFLDTPGHSAFTAMRARGASCTDIVILVVAADDGVMPQTIEAIQHAKAAGVPIIVAVNKIDKPEADAEKVIGELAQHEVIPEDWGGDTMFVKVSAKQGTGIDALLEAVMLQAEVMELTAVDQGAAQGVVIEARVDRGRGPVASILVQSGKLNKGDMLLAGLEYGRIKAMNDDQGLPCTEAGPSVPVEVLGLSGAPQAGDKFQVVEDERKAREVALFRQGKHREIKLSRQQATKLEGFMDRMKQGDVRILNIVLKADVQGSVEALTDSLQKISNDEIGVKVISKGVGGFNESDVNLALASGAILIGFNVRADATARRLAQKEDIEINYYSIIYDVVENVRSAVLGLLGPEVKEKIVGLAEVRDVFRSTKFGAIAGCMVVDGKIKRGNPIRVLRDNVVIYTGELESLRRFKENVNEVRSGTECGIGVKNYNDVKVGDQIEIYEIVEVAREEL